MRNVNGITRVYVQRRRARRVSRWLGWGLMALPGMALVAAVVILAT